MRFITFMLIFLLVISNVAAISIDKVSIESNVQGIPDEVLVIEVTQAEPTSIFTAQKINDELDEGAVQSGFTLQMTPKSQECIYTIRPTASETWIAGDPIIVWGETLGYSIDDACNDAIDKAQDFCPGGVAVAHVAVDIGIISQKCAAVCVGFGISGFQGRLQSPEMAVSTEVTLTTDAGETYRSEVPSTVASASQTTIFQDAVFKVIKSGVAGVRWLGNLDTGVQCPIAIQEDKQSVYLVSGEKYVVASYSSWLAYESYRGYDADFGASSTSEFAQCMVNIGNQYKYDLSSIVANIKSQCVYTYNLKRMNAEKPITWQMQGGSPAIATIASDGYNGQVSLTAPRLLAYPRYEVFLDADKVNWRLESGTPKIISAEQPSCITMDATSETVDSAISVRVRNDGTGEGDFLISINCPSPFTDDFERVAVAPGAEKTVQLVVSAQTDSATENAICTVTAEDKSPVNIWEQSPKDSTQISLCVEGRPICSAGDKYCSNNEWWECDTSVGRYEPTGEVCFDDDDDDGVGGIATWLLILTLILAGGASGYVYIWTSPISRWIVIKGKPVGKWLRAGIAVGIFIAVFIAVPTLIQNLIDLFTFK